MLCFLGVSVIILFGNSYMMDPQRLLKHTLLQSTTKFLHIRVHLTTPTKDTPVSGILLGWLVAVAVFALGKISPEGVK